MTDPAAFARLQELNDSAFHVLCDALLSSIESRYRFLTPYGRNIRGQSVRGQPDSYVGPSVSQCTIAFQYSTQKTKWQKKAIADLAAAKQECPDAVEFVYATPVDIDRSSGRGKKQGNWIAEAQVAVGASQLRLFGGRLLAQLLDEQRQDIRYVHLGIPCSRLSAEAILVRCQKLNADAIARLIAQKRYSPDEYVVRRADNDLLRLWGRCVDSRSRNDSYRLVPLVGDSGIGKSSLVARFIGAISACWPVLLIQARDVTFTSPDSLVRYVVELVGGVLSGNVRDVEEAAVACALSGNRHFTVVLDGLDEATDPAAVRRAVGFWLGSSLGEAATLIAASRPEFWQRCAEPSWRQHIVDPASVERIEPKRPHEPYQPTIDHLFGLSIIAHFSDRELQEAGRRAGFSGDPFAGSNQRVHDEVRHPFTFHAAVELLRGGMAISELRTRTDLIDLWINERLKAEADRSNDRLTPAVLRQALVGTAERARMCPGGWLRVDDLAGLPRFDASHPPGSAIESLLAAGLLESRQPSGGEIRFTFDAVQDFFCAESDAAELSEANVATVADRYAVRSFTETEWQLERLGRHLDSHDIRDNFAQLLLDRDIFKTAALLRGTPDGFSAVVRDRVVELLCGELKNPVRIRRAKAAEMLGWFNCQTAQILLPKSLLPTDELGGTELVILTETILRLSIADCAALVPKCHWFRRGQFYYDVRQMLHATSPEFRKRLADLAIDGISRANRGSDEYAGFVGVLAYCADVRVLPHIARFFEIDSDLHWYEVAALVELGTRDAASLFFRFVSTLASSGKTTHELCNDKDDKRIWSATCTELRARRERLSPDFEERVAAMLGSDNEVESTVARSLTQKFPSQGLLRQAFALVTDKRPGWTAPFRFGDVVGYALDFDSWSKFWAEFPERTVRNILIDAARRVCDPRLEPILLECLDDSDLRDAAANTLGELGCYRASPQLREQLAAVLADPQPDRHRQFRAVGLVRALRRFRDTAAVELIAKVARADSIASLDALAALGDIQTADTSKALMNIAGSNGGDLQVGALIHHGSQECVQFAVGLAKQRPDGLHWLLEKGMRITYFEKWTRGKFYHHVFTAPVVEFVEACSQEVNDQDLKELFDWIGYVDDEPVRRLLRQLGLGGAPLFPIADSKKWTLAALQALAERGDESVVSLAAEQLMHDEWFGRRFFEYDLENFDSGSLVRELVLCLDKSTSPTELRRLIKQIGRRGASADATVLASYVKSLDVVIANEAAEAIARLADPRLIPELWR